MRNCFYLLLLSIVFISCKKLQPLTGEYHLIKITYTGTSPYKTEFEYDAQGRLTRQSSAQAGNPPVAQYGLSYTGNEVAISYLNNPSFIQQDTRFHLDDQNRPIKRTYSGKETFQAQTSTPEWHFESDTTNYEYDASGFLTRYSGVSTDSISYSPGGGAYQTSNEVITYVAVYQMAEGNLQSVTKTSIQNLSITNQPTYSYQRNIEATTVFSYDRNYPNHFDFKNAFLFSELRVLPFTQYFPNPGFLNYPNKAVTTTTTKDGNGVVLSTDISVWEPDLGFNTDGYILTQGGNSSTIFGYTRF